MQLVWLGVFHEMHCLNVIRKLVWFEYYDVLADLVAGRNNMRNHLSKPLEPTSPPRTSPYTLRSPRVKKKFFF